MIFELVPHQDPAQIGMAVEANAVEIENLALLEFGAAPDRRERWQARALCTIAGPHANDHRAVFVRHRVKVINRFEITRENSSCVSSTSFSSPSTTFFTFTFFFTVRSSQSTPVTLEQ